MTHYLEVSFQSVSATQQEILIAFLDMYGFNGFEEGHDCLKAFIPTEDYKQINLPEILHEIPALQHVSFTIKEIKTKNWNEAWEQHFKPVTVGSQLYIRASFHAKRKDMPLEIIIDPKMSFGTGHHATTNMMCELMLQTDFKNKSVFDFGSGTGILSILASKLGASFVYALDEEEWAYYNGIENCRRNAVKNVQVVLGNESKFPKQSFDIILANINKNIICKNMASLSLLLKSNGLLFISGFLQQDAEELSAYANRNNLYLMEQKEKDGWLCMKFAKP